MTRVCQSVASLKFAGTNKVTDTMNALKRISEKSNKQLCCLTKEKTQHHSPAKTLNRSIGFLCFVQ